MRKVNSTIKVDFNSEKGGDNADKTYFAYIPLENMVCYAAAESYDGDNDINSAKLAVESVLTAFERNPSFKNLKQYIRYAHDQIVANSVKDKLEAAITVVVSDYTRIRYASCGNIKLFLISDNAYYLKGETQTYYQHAADEYGLDKAPISENKNLSQYLGKKNGVRPYISPKIDLYEESTILFATCSFWERVDEVELLDAYEESDPDTLLGNLQELYLLTQLKDPAIKHYTLASLYVEKTFKEDTANKKKRRRLIIIAVSIVIILAIILLIVVSIMRSGDRRAMAEIERLDNEGIRYSNYGYYIKALEQYEKANELTGKLKNNLQYVKAKRTLTDTIAERWHLFNSIMVGDGYMERDDYSNALKAYQDAQAAYHEVYERADTHSGLMVSDILTEKIKHAKKYITVGDLTELGEAYELSELYQEAIARFREAEDIVKTMGDLTLRKELMTLIFEAERKLHNSIQDRLIYSIRVLMIREEDNLNFELAMKYCEVILDLHKELDIIDSQILDDQTRIKEKSQLNQQADEYIEKAKTATAAAAAARNPGDRAEEYEKAVDAYSAVLGIYGEMGISTGHEQVIRIANEMNRIDKIIQDTYAAEQAEEDRVQAEDEEEQPGADQDGEVLAPGDAYG